MSEDVDCLPSATSSRKLSLTENGHDKVDALPAYMKITWLHAFLPFISLSIYVYDIGYNIAVAVFHYSNKDYWYFGLTLTFILIPTLVMTGISWRWYVLDARKQEIVQYKNLKLIFILQRLGLFSRYLESIFLTIYFIIAKDTSEKKECYTFVVYADTIANKLRFFGCLMGSAPQLVLQIYILALQNPLYGDNRFMLFTQINSCLASLVSLSWSLVSYQRSLRLSLPNKVSLTWQGIAVQFLWRFSVIAARVLALALFAAIYNWYISIVCGVHCIIMFAWIVSMKTSFCENRCEELGYNAVLAVMYIFCYFNPVDSPTRYRYAIYYTFMFCENTLLMTLWFTKAEPHLWYRIPAFVGHYMSFFIGLLYMLVYYLVYHPSKSCTLEI
ncbi:XK-related protein 6 [Tetranychus urticae]|uniref:XK-related protein n=1 Tax=Tetranychus urticae TaxID=32264 RepID=T1K710_TETUR|nr:XK-related protein 6 [Tetranychus urticae]